MYQSVKDGFLSLNLLDYLEKCHCRIPFLPHAMLVVQRIIQTLNFCSCPDGSA